MEVGGTFRFSHKLNISQRLVTFETFEKSDQDEYFLKVYSTKKYFPKMYYLKMYFRKYMYMYKYMFWKCISEK